ncbi:MAG: MG2 domain-containing protein, partial [Bacteroidota bacterium]
KVDALPIGEYLLVACTDKDFSSKKTIIGARLFYVSGISYVNNNKDFFVLNRENGQPLANAEVQIWQQRYDYTQSKYIKEKGKKYNTDANGFFRMDKPKRETTSYSNYSYLLDITHNNDRLFVNELVNDYYYYSASENEPPKTTTSIHLFTDRSIYRPGQTVYFKGIVLSKNPQEKKGGIRTGYSTTVILRDANYKDVDTIKVKTNEFGSFNGKFHKLV